MSSFSCDPSLPLNDTSIHPGDRPDDLLSVSSDSHLVPSVSIQSSGCTMREYEEQINNYRKDNLNLKLRIYMMEESLGFHGNDEKNAQKLNVDLRVENEELKKELSDKTDLLGQAYSALSDLEEVYRTAESESRDLKDEISKLRDHNCENVSEHPSNNDVGLGILEDAFGSLSDVKNISGKNENFETILKDILNIIFDGEVPKEDSENMVNAVHEKIQRFRSDNCFNNEVQTLSLQLKNKNNQLMSMSKVFLDLKRDLSPFLRSSSPANEDPLESNRDIHNIAVEVVKSLRTKNDLLTRLQDELEDEKKLSEKLEMNLQTEKESNKDLKKQVGHKTGIASSAEKEAESKAEKLTKSYEFCQSLTKALAEQKGLVEKFKKDSKSKDSVIKKITDEYNDLKVKVRSRGDRSGALISELDDVKSREALLSVEAENLKDYIDNFQGGSFEEIQNFVMNFKMTYLRQGCSTAMKCYQKRIGNIQKDVNSAVKLMRIRLEELAEFLQRVLNQEESLELSRRFSTEFSESLHKSLSESRRLSTSLLNDSSILNESLLLGESIMEEIEAAFNFKDKSADRMLKDCGVSFVELSTDDMNFIECLKNEITKKIVSKSSLSRVEVDELKYSLEEEKRVVERLTQIQIDMKKQIAECESETESKTEELRLVYSELDLKKSRIFDEEKKITALRQEIVDCADKESKIKQAFSNEMLILKSQLTDLSSSKSELEQRLDSLQSERERIVLCCKENEDLKKELKTTKEAVEYLNKLMARDKAKRSEIEKQMANQLVKTRKVLQQTKKIAGKNSEDKEN